MNKREILAVLSRGGKLGFLCDDAECEVTLAPDGVHVVIRPFDDEGTVEYAFVGDLDKLYELQRELEVDFYEIASNTH